MIRSQVRGALTLLAVAALGLSVAACGKQGALERPAPLWNAEKKAAYEAERRKASATVNQPARANGAQENIDPASSNRTTRAAPLGGTQSDPFGGPSGAGFPSATPN
jgi:predicted small lipoprotein YifL